MRIARVTVSLVFVLFLGVLITGCGGGASATLPPPKVTDFTINVRANHLVFDSSRQRLYASVGASALSYGNSIVVINPSDGSVESTIPVGNDPDLIVLSPDQKYLYISALGDHSIERLNLSTRAIELKIQLQPNSGTPTYALDIAAMPGATTTIAVVVAQENISPSWLKLAIYDNDVQRPDTAGRPDGYDIGDQIALPSPGTTVYAGVTSITSLSINRFGVSASGASFIDSTDNVFTQLSDRMLFSGNYIYTRFGRKFDPATLRIAGQFPIQDAEAFTVDSTVNRAYYLRNYQLNPTSNSPVIHEFDTGTYAEVGNLVLATGPIGKAVDLVKMGNGGFAFIELPPYPDSPKIAITIRSFSN